MQHSITNNTKKIKRAEQKVISILGKDSEIEALNQYVRDGWIIASLYPTDKGLVGMIEKRTDENQNTNEEDKVIYIPPKKKIKIT